MPDEATRLRILHGRDSDLGDLASPQDHLGNSDSDNSNEEGGFLHSKIAILSLKIIYRWYRDNNIFILPCVGCSLQESWLLPLF